MTGEHRVLGVDDQVQQHLLDLMPVGEDLRQRVGERKRDGDVAGARFVRAERERFANDVVEIDHHPRALALV